MLGVTSADTFDPGKNLYISAGKTISASQFSYPSDSSNDTNALKFGIESSNVETITGSEIKHQQVATQLTFILLLMVILHQ